MGGFLADLITFGVESAVNYKLSKDRVEKAAEILRKMIVEDEEISSDEFLKMYDTRIYNFENKQDDIKIMKDNDFAGVYILHNVSKGIYLVGKSGKVLRKVNRQFNGYENELLFSDYKNHDNFGVRIIKLENTHYDNIDILERDMVKKYGQYKHEKECEQNKKEKKSFFSKLFG